MPPEPFEEKAIEALREVGGCSQERAERLLAAWKEAGATEAVGIVAGALRVSSSVTDQRVERVELLVDELEEEPLPNRYELGALLRVTSTQARTVLRNWQARYSDHYENYMGTLAAEGDAGTGGTEEVPTHFVTYKNSDVLEYAVDCLRRNGLQRGLKVDRSALTLEIPQTVADAEGRDALAVLGIEA